jgi:hypothetical protein
MIILQKATTNQNLILTLKENTTLSNPVYLFVFSKGGNDYPVIGTDLATAAQKERFNKFTIIEGASDPTNGSLIIGNPGVYELNVYEQSSTTNLDPDSASGLVETTLARVIDSETSNYTENIIAVSYSENVI